MDPVKSLWEEIRELTEIPKLTSPPTPLSFLRRHVAQNQPCHVSNSVSHWPSLSLWAHSDRHLIDSLSLSLSSQPVSVSVHLTPSGRADALAPHPNGDGSVCFASGFVQKVPFGDVFGLVYESSRENGFVAYAQHQNDCFRGEYAALLEKMGMWRMRSTRMIVFGASMLRYWGNGFVAYAQHQNDCFRGEYAALLGDCESHIPWASEAFGCLPEAVNLWIGNECSETSFHKDHYENIYVVVTGEKHFLLLPPTDVHRMYIRDYPAANYSYCKDSGEFTLELEDPVRHVPWSSVDPYPLEKDREREMAKFPLYFNGPKPFEVTVKAGEMLYLPSMWFHHVRQSPDSRGRTIAVNYWYDMQFDIKYAYFNFLQSIPYPLSHDQASREMRCLGSSLDTSIIDTEEKLDITLVVDDNSENDGE